MTCTRRLTLLAATAIVIGATASTIGMPAQAAGPAMLRCGTNVNCKDGAAVIRAMDRAAKRIETAAPGSPLLGSYASMCRDAKRRAEGVRKTMAWSAYSAQPMLNTCNIGLLRLQ